MNPISPSGIPASLPSQVPAAKAGSEADRLQETARELEGVFLGLLMKAMRSSVGNGGLFKEGMDSQTYRDMFDQEVGRSMARAGGIGLAQLILRDQLLRQTAADSGEQAANGGAVEPPGAPGRNERGDVERTDSSPVEKNSQVPSPDDR
jgi:Rod binding domain-containing protein